MSNFTDIKKVGSKGGGILKSILFIIALVLIFGYFGIGWSDVKASPFVQFIWGIFSSFWSS